jgi:hypothetical protein
MLAQAQTSRPLSLWNLWWDAIRLLRPAFSHLRSGSGANVGSHDKQARWNLTQIMQRELRSKFRTQIGL